MAAVRTHMNEAAPQPSGVGSGRLPANLATSVTRSVGVMELDDMRTVRTSDHASPGETMTNGSNILIDGVCVLFVALYCWCACQSHGVT